MNFFIYGGRQSGKTRQAISIIKMFGIPVVFEGIYSQYKNIESENIKVYREHYGLSKYIRFYEDLDNMRESYCVKHDGQEHTIITCTPNNHEDKKETRASEFFEYAVKSKWAIIKLGFEPEVLGSIPHIDPRLVIGSIYGEWYDEEKAKAEKKKKEQESKDFLRSFLL